MAHDPGDEHEDPPKRSSKKDETIIQPCGRANGGLDVQPGKEEGLQVHLASPW